MGSLFLLQGNLPDPGIKPRSPTLQADSLPAKPQGKPKNTGVGSLSLLQRIFPTHEIEPGSPALQEDSLPAEPQGKPKNTGVGSLSLFQRIFLTHGIEPGSPASQAGSLPPEFSGKPYHLVVFSKVYGVAAERQATAIAGIVLSCLRIRKNFNGEKLINVNNLTFMVLYELYEDYAIPVMNRHSKP